MFVSATLAQWFIGLVLILSSLGVVMLRKPVHASLSFLLTLLSLAALYLQLSAEFIAVMQILVYAGAILVIFMFVIVLFQDAHGKIAQFKPKSLQPFLFVTAMAFVLGLLFLYQKLIGSGPSQVTLPQEYGQAQGIGQALYLDFFFPFEAVILLFLVAIVGAVYIGKGVPRNNNKTIGHRLKKPFET